MRWLKFTFRDLFWLILLVASVVPWIIEHGRLAKDIELYRGRSRGVVVLLSGTSMPKSTERTAALSALASLSDEQLDERLDESLADNSLSDDDELCLAEMVRRGMVSSLQRHYENALCEAGDRVWSFGGQDLLLTALRRAEGKPDPIQIRLSIDSRTPKSTYEWVPHVRAEIENIDADHEPLWHGFRDEPSQDWRFVLTDDKGRQVADSNYDPFDDLDFWQVSYRSIRRGPLKFGEKDSSSIDLRQHIAPPRSGKYQLQAVYRRAGVPRDAALSGLFITKSEPISVIVHNPNERGSKPSAADVRTAFAAFVACGMLAFFGLSFRARVRNWLRFVTIRDALWFVIVLVVLALAWLDHARQVDELWKVFPDSEAQWSIELADSATTK